MRFPSPSPPSMAVITLPPTPRPALPSASSRSSQHCSLAGGIVTSNMKSFLLLLIPAYLCAADTKTEPVKVQKANYELAQRWTAAKIGKLVFDTQVPPHWLEGDAFWDGY